MAVIDTFTDLSGDGVLVLDGGFANAALVVVRNFGHAEEILQGGEHRWNRIGWIALGDQVDSITGDASPQYAWRDWTWLQFGVTLTRYALAQLWDVNGYPNALNYHFGSGVHADILTLRET